ncbi:T9SS type B sorting domain-containing protein [Winogradskyella immobilis]|uniref:T9SS type B sorting domain-containing protein n=1 Tax=Winogradskyella immobilis TaxID=2816852 RepID=A0ABS8EQ98_9FLAO|nr:T9SS type B sorting domain-containing protein [Winogradskyella immobilis]MCC1485051.1 T9SS type B sorting domain-containing protein [Winogradskyella immobilis]MCG0017143.1 T9SS type B sorting domain-containing protein [Winogradskyella immobilis]
MHCRLRNIMFVLLIITIYNSNAQVILSHNIGNTPIKTDMFSCETDESWSRVFKLSDYGILPNEQFMITSSQIGLSESNDGAYLFLRVYNADNNFPNLSDTPFSSNLIGSRPMGRSPVLNEPEVVQVNFDEPIIIPAGIERIMVSIDKIEDFNNTSSAKIFIAGTQEDTDVSWYKGCEDTFRLTPTSNLSPSVPNANFYINVTGEKFNVNNLGSTTRLTHNLCDDIIETDIHSCSSSFIYWARTFTLADFGISTDEKFTINSGQVGINKTGYLPEISFNVYKIDDNFPNSFSESDLIGSSQYQTISSNIRRNSQIIQVDFETPILVPSDVEKILVEVHKGIVSGDGIAFIAGSTQDNDISWQRSCTNVAGGTTFDNNEYVSTAEFGQPNANFYINVTGSVNHLTNTFQMNISNICSEFFKEFSITNPSNLASVQWNFGDPNSGTSNTSLDLSPFHDFSEDGIYIITALVTDINGNTETITETINVIEPPEAFGIENVHACEDNFGSGFSSSFNLSNITQEIVGNQTDIVITFIDGSGNEYDSLPNGFTNTVIDRETIVVRVAHDNNQCCYSEISFDLIVNKLPNLTSVIDLNECDNDNDGFALFDLEQVKTSILENETNIDVEFYYEDGSLIQEPLNFISNNVINEENITIRTINTNTSCHVESTFKLIVNPTPIANPLSDIVGCDDNNDGISEYFDTSHIESDVIGSQTGVQVSYFDSSGNILPSPLPNPYTNSTNNIETLTVRITNTSTNCFSETLLTLRTSSQPQINTPTSIYACDEDNGFANFDTSNIENEIIGNQSGLSITYLDINGNTISNFVSTNFLNTEAWNQKIIVRVENETNNQCYSETEFNLIVNPLPEINLEETYSICNLDPSINLSVDPNYNSYDWVYEGGPSISSSNSAEIIEQGIYTLTITKLENGIVCENSFSFELIRSTLPEILQVNQGELGNNFIEIIVTGDGDFEYSIDGINYQDSNIFENIRGGIYTVSVRDKEGCGEDTKEVVLVDYPKFFTPNNDGVNDFWQIRGVSRFPNSKISIYDRYGKLITELSHTDIGWDGMYKGTYMPTNDYWFSAKLNDEIVFSGHFTLKR